MMSDEAIRVGTFHGKPNDEMVTLDGVRARVWQFRETARHAALTFSLTSTHNRRVEACQLPLVLVESGTV